MGHFMKLGGMWTLALKPKNVFGGVLANIAEIAT